MYTRVLVPLDGSELAEAILPFAEQVAGPLDAEVVLLRVVEPILPAEAIASAGVVTPDSLALRELDGKRYLSEVERRLSKKALRVRTRVTLGPPAEAILATARTTGAATATSPLSRTTSEPVGTGLRCPPVLVEFSILPGSCGEARE